MKIYQTTLFLDCWLSGLCASINSLEIYLFFSKIGNHVSINITGKITEL